MKKIVFPVDPYTFTGSAVIVGFVLANELSSDEQDSVGNWLQVVGLIMQTYASQVTVLESIQKKQNDDKKNDINLDTLIKAMDKIKQELAELKKEAC